MTMKQTPDEKRRTFTRTDLVLILILLAAGACLLFFRQRQGSGSMIRIYSDNELLKELPLDRNDSFTVITDLGTNTVVI